MDSQTQFVRIYRQECGVTLKGPLEFKPFVDDILSTTLYAKRTYPSILRYFQNDSTSTGVKCPVFPRALRMATLR